MSIKDLFGKKSGKILPLSSAEDIGKEVESVELLTSLKKQKEKFIPEKDFSDPKSFAKFGSAEKYYDDSIRLVYKTYPYDGSRNEKVQWHNSASLLTNYVFDEMYPKNNGYINLGLNYGTQVSGAENYSLSNNPEFILIKGGPNTYSQTSDIKDLFGKSNYYSEEYKRASNLNLDGDSGVTVEFYLKKNDTSGSSIQTIFDLWNSSSIGTSDYARFKIEIHPGILGEENNFYVTFKSGSAGSENVELQADSFIDGKWHHFAIAAVNSNSQIIYQLFKDGSLIDQKIQGTSVQIVKGPMNATIGSLITKNGTTGSANLGWGKLSGSLDEFRYWKIKRTDKEILRYYFTEVYGGTNTDDANTDLGVYYKFNEGVFSTSSLSSVDRNVIDYSGRISNGTWFGYILGSRETGSALVESGFTQEEPKDPILYSNHPDILNLISEVEKKTLTYDRLNNSSIYNSFANWILEDDEQNGGELSNLTQILSEFLDEFYFYIESLTTLKDQVYRDKNPLPFAKRLLESHGLNTLELFSESTILEAFLSRDEGDVFEEKIHHIKNTIYQNIYNNLLYIYRSKGTEKSIRNLLRCFGVDTELVKLNLYADEQKFTFEDRLEYTSQKRKYIDFNNPDRFEGTVYQKSGSESNTAGFIAGELETRYLGNTLEVETIFPRKFDQNEDFYFETLFITSSLFGMHQPKSISEDMEWSTLDYANFQVFAVRPEQESKDVRFLLSSSYFNLELFSPLFKDVYTDQKWLLSVRIRHEKHPFAGSVVGADIGDYIVELHGINSELDIIKEQFSVTGTINSTMGDNYFQSLKKIYLGAHHYNFTGSTVVGSDGKEQLTDVQIGAARFWLNYLPDSILEMHSKDMTNHGPEYYIKNVDSYLLPQIKNSSVPQSRTLTLYWNFDLSEKTDNGAGIGPTNLNDAGFDIIDFSSGSFEHLEGVPLISSITNKLYPGRADFFLRNDTEVISYEYVPNAKIRLPEILNNDDLVNILQRDDEVYTRDTLPVNHYFAIEKSMYQNISEEMLRWMGTIIQFNNLIGEPVNRYEIEYKQIQYLRTLFFQKVENTPDFEKFLQFYKWIDESVARILMQFIPGSANTITTTSDMVESHILERNKYRHKLPTLEFRKKDPIAAVRTINELKYNWKFGHAPIPLDESNNCLWWKEREEKEGDREGIFAALKSTYDRKFTTVYDLNIEPIVIINKNPKEQEIVKQTTKFGSGGYLEIDISKIIINKDCDDK